MSDDKVKKTEGFKWIVGIFLLALGLRILLVIKIPVVATDAIWFYNNAKHLLAGDFYSVFTHRYHPGYTVLIATLARIIGGNIELAGKIVSVLLGSLSIFPLYFIVKRVFSERAGIFASLCLALHPIHMRLSCDTISDVSYIFFFLCGIYFLMTALKENKLHLYVLTGLVCAISYLTRPEGIEILVISLFLIPLFNYKNIKNDYYLRPIRMMLVLIGFLILAYPYLRLIKEYTGEWKLTMKRSEIIVRQAKTSDYMGISGKYLENPKSEPTPLMFSKDELRIAGYIHENDYIGLIAYSSNEVIKTIYYPFVLFLLIGVFYKYKRKKNNVELVLFLFCFILLHFFVLWRVMLNQFYMSTRHLLSISILFFAWSGVGVEKLENLITAKFFQVKNNVNETIQMLKKNFILISKPSFIILVFILLVTLPKGLKEKRTDQLGLKACGEWMKENLKDEKIIFAGPEKTAYYAGLESFYEISGRDYRGTIHDAKLVDINYLAFYLQDQEKIRPDFVKQIWKSKDLVFQAAWTEYKGRDVKNLLLFKLIYPEKK